MAADESTVVVGVFQSRELAEQAIEDLRQAGFSDEHTGFVMRYPAMEADRAPAEAQSESANETATGAVTGGVVGGLVGAFTALLIPGLGPALAGGILISSLGGAAIGAATGGFLGLFKGTGVSEDQALQYEQAFQAGYAILMVHADGRSQEAFRIMRHRQTQAALTEEAEGANEMDPEQTAPHDLYETRELVETENAPPDTNPIS